MNTNCIKGKIQGHSGYEFMDIWVTKNVHYSDASMDLLLVSLAAKTGEMRVLHFRSCNGKLFLLAMSPLSTKKPPPLIKLFLVAFSFEYKPIHSGFLNQVEHKIKSQVDCTN